MVVYMKNFSYQVITEVVFGKDTHLQISELCSKYGFNKPLIIYGGNSAVKSGLLESVTNQLDKSNIPYSVIGGVVPNPHVTLVNQAVELAQENNIDSILAVGGGSVIDTAKAVAMAVANNIEDAWDIFTGDIAPTTALPIASILTISAAGSETSTSVVITNEQNNLKKSYNHSCIRPVFAVMNPELTFTLPKYQIAAGTVDIIMHTLERYFCDVDEKTDLVDGLSAGLIKATMTNGIVAYNNPNDYNAQAELMWCGSLSHTGLMATGKEANMVCHRIEHELSGEFDVAHGAGLSALWPTWARYSYKEALPRFVKFATEVMDCKHSPLGDEQTALDGIKALEDFFTKIDMPVTIGQLGVSLDETLIEKLANQASVNNTKTITTFMKYDTKAMADIYRLAQ